MKNGNKGRALFRWIRERVWLIAGIMLFLAVLTVTVLYIHWTVVPLDRYEMGPSGDPSRWQFTLPDGTPLEPAEGRLPVDGPDAVVVCETRISGSEGELALIVVSSKSSDCVFLLDGQLIYSPSGRYRDGAFSDDAFSTASGQFGLPGLGEEGRLTMIVQFRGEENRLSRMPKLTLYPSVIHYYQMRRNTPAFKYGDISRLFSQDVKTDILPCAIAIDLNL